MAFRLVVDAVDRSEEVSDVKFDGEHNERSTLQFTTKPGGFQPGLRDEVLYYEQDATTPRFGGVIFTRTCRGLADNTDAAYFVCDCVDWNYYLDRILIDGGVLTGTITLKAAIEWVMTFLAGHGFTLDAAQENGPSHTVTGFRWERKTANAIFQDLTVWSGGWVRTVSPTKVIRFVQPNLVAPSAPFAITVATKRASLVEWTESSERFATRVEVIWGGTGTRQKTEAFEIDATIIANGYYQTELATVPTAGVSATITAVPATIGAPGSGAQLIWQASTHRVLAGTYTPVLGHDLTITYTAQYPGTTIVNGVGSPTLALPPVQKDDITDAPTALAYANGLLAQHNQDVREFDIQVVDEGLKPGQVLSIDMANRFSSGLTAAITGVSEVPGPGTFWRYAVRAISGVYQGSPLDFWRGVGGGGSTGATVVTVTTTPGTNPNVGFPLTKTDDTNVTLTLGGGHAAAVLAETSLTLGWTGSLAVARGGTGLSSLTANRIPYGNGTSAFQSSANLTFNGSTLAITGAGTFSTSVTTPLLSASGALSIFPTGAATIQTGSGNLTLSPAGDIVLGPVGNDILPSAGYTKNLGALTNKYLTLHAAELWVETLVAQDTMATIGGRVLVGPTTSLTADLTAVATSIVVKHNQMASGDRVFMQANGFYEAMAITSGPSGSGPYTYSVTRNLDGSGANTWTAGDAVFNTGTTGDGFIDLYSINGLIPGSTAGPTIVGNVRTGTTYSDIAARWAIGNLNGLYGYGTDTYGAAFGDPSNSYLTIDATNGIRMIGDAGTMFSMDTAGNATFAGRLTIGTGRNMLSNTEFRGESTTPFGAAVGTGGGSEGPKTGMQSAVTTAVGDSSQWLWGFSNTTGSPQFDMFAGSPGIVPPGGGNLWLRNHTVAASSGSVKQFHGPAIAVAPGQRVEWSLYGIVDGTGTAGINTFLQFYDTSNASVGSLFGTTVAVGGNVTLIEDYERSGVIGDAPAGAAYVVPFVQVIYATGTPVIPNHAVITRLYFGIAAPGQTELTPWAPGGTTLIDGTMLATNMAIANIIRSSGATGLDTGTGFWLDATSTPTFRVGDPSGNRVRWDGTDVTIGQGNVTLDASGIRITPTSTLASISSYRWNNLTGSGDFGVYGFATTGAVSSKSIAINLNDDSGGTRQTAASLSSKIGTAADAVVSVFNSTGLGERVTLQVINAGASSYTLILQPGLLTANAGTAVRFANYGAGTATFDASGNITSVSDERLKTQIQPFESGLSAILGLVPVRYRWTPESKLDTDHDYVGFVAQAVQRVLPDAVGMNRDGMLSLQDRTILAALVNAVQELSSQIIALKAQEPKL